MIISKGNINELIVSVTEKTTLSAPVNYLWEFKNKDTKLNYYCIAQVNIFYGHQEQFLIEEKTSPNNLVGQINLPKGDYLFKIYQQVSSTNVDPKLTTSSTFEPYVEIGLVTVTGTIQADTIYNGSTLIDTVYNGI